MAAPRTAILLAAGAGERIGGRKPLRKLLGRPLAWYPVSVLHLLGVSEFVVVTTRGLAGELRGLVESVAGRGSARVVVNEEQWRENGWSLLLGAGEAGAGEAVVSMSDHVYSPLVAERVAASPPSRGYVVGCDAEPGWVDVSEATRVLAEPPLAAAVAKGLEPWSCIDNGVHALRLDPLILREAAALVSGQRGGVVRLNELLTALASRGRLVYVADCTGLPWLEVDTPGDLERAEKGPGRRVVEHVLHWLHG